MRRRTISFFKCGQEVRLGKEASDGACGERRAQLAGCSSDYLGLILLVVSGVVSLYSKEIKEFLHTWPIKKLHANDRNMSQHRLRTLEWLHNNTYNLVLYLALSVTETVQTAIYWNCAIVVGSLVFFHHVPQYLSFLSKLVGVCIGKGTQVNIVLMELRDYEKSTTRLKSAIAYHEEKLTLKAPAV